MTKEHGLAGLFGDDGTVTTKTKGGEEQASSELPPVLDDADRSPLDMLAEKIGFEDQTFEKTPSPGKARREEPEDYAADPFPPSSYADADPFPPSSYADDEDDYGGPQDASPFDYGDDERLADEVSGFSGAEAQEGILCFLLEGHDARGRRRTLEALNMAAGNGAVRLRTLPGGAFDMDRVLREAISDTDCAYVAFLSSGTEPADDWASEVAKAFEDQPKAAAVGVRAANSDPLSPWARVSFFMDEAERQIGIARGFDTMVFRVSALRELGDQLGVAVRNGNLVPAIQGRGHRIGNAPEARVSLLTPSKRRDVLDHVREQARLAARIKAKGRGPLRRTLSAAGIMLSVPMRIMAVRSAAKRSIGSTQFREVASKATMAIFADRRVRALTMLKPGRDLH